MLSTVSAHPLPLLTVPNDNILAFVKQARVNCTNIVYIVPCETGSKHLSLFYCEPRTAGKDDVLRFRLDLSLELLDDCDIACI